MNKRKSYCIYLKTAGIVKFLGILCNFFDIINLRNLIYSFIFGWNGKLNITVDDITIEPDGIYIAILRLRWLFIFDKLIYQIIQTFYMSRK